MKRMCTGTNNTSHQSAQGGILGKKMSRRDVLYLGATASIAGALSGGIVLSEGAINPAHAASSATISVSGTQWGVSTAYIGATEANVRFNTADMSDLGINTYLSALISSGTGTMWQFDSTHMDVVVGSPALSNGHVTFTVPGTCAVLLQF
jgi:hypothetical protein